MRSRKKGRESVSGCTAFAISSGAKLNTNNPELLKELATQEHWQAQINLAADEGKFADDPEDPHVNALEFIFSDVHFFKRRVHSF